MVDDSTEPGAHGAGHRNPDWAEVLPLTTVETFLAAMVEAGPDVAEHLVRAANEMLLAAQALMGAAERRLAEQRRHRDESATATDPGAAAAPDLPDDAAATASGPTTHLRSVDDVAS